MVTTNIPTAEGAEGAASCRGGRSKEGAASACNFATSASRAAIFVTCSAALRAATFASRAATSATYSADLRAAADAASSASFWMRSFFDCMSASASRKRDTRCTMPCEMLNS